MPSPEFWKVLSVAVMLMFFSVTVFGGQKFGPYENVSVLKVKDGDTISVMTLVWPNTYVKIDVRVRGIDTPETRNGIKSGKRIPQCEISRGVGAKSYAAHLFANSETVKLINVDPSATKYAGRISGDFMLDEGKFSDLMIEAGHAVVYEGGAREIWPCED